eukprot:4780873-Pyramimonas_sp.AAC.1
MSRSSYACLHVYRRPWPHPPCLSRPRQLSDVMVRSFLRSTGAWRGNCDDEYDGGDGDGIGDDGDGDGDGDDDGDGGDNGDDDDY